MEVLLWHFYGAHYMKAGPNFTCLQAQTCLKI